MYVLIFNVIIDYLSFRRVLFYALLGVFLYACTDELHQAFVPGRACAFTDVLIDTSGGALAMVLIAMINQLQIITKSLKKFSSLSLLLF